METSHPILTRKIEHIATSDEFLKVCKQNNLLSLEEILHHTTDELLKKPGFNMRMMMELITILKGNKLEYLLKEVY